MFLHLPDAFFYSENKITPSVWKILDPPCLQCEWYYTILRHWQALVSIRDTFVRFGKKRADRRRSRAETEMKIFTIQPPFWTRNSNGHLRKNIRHSVRGNAKRFLILSECREDGLNSPSISVSNGRPLRILRKILVRRSLRMTENIFTIKTQLLGEFQIFIFAH